MLQYGMDAAVEYLTQWVDGTLQPQPLLDVSAFLAITMVFPQAPNTFQARIMNANCFSRPLSQFFVELFSHFWPHMVIVLLHFLFGRCAIMSSFSSSLVAEDVPQTLEPLTGILGPLETYIQTVFKVFNSEF